MKGLQCTNCEREVPPGEAKFFGADDAKVQPHTAIFVCPECHAMASLLRQRALQQLKSMLFLTEECIRLAIVEHRLQLAPLGPERELTKREVFQELLRIVKEEKEHA